MLSELQFRPARAEDAGLRQTIRRTAFAPIFPSFRTLLGDEIYEIAQRREDEAQGELLSSLITGEPGWKLSVALLDSEVAGFVAVHVNTTTLVDEIGLNAVEPTRAGRGLGSAMYE